MGDCWPRAPCAVCGDTPAGDRSAGGGVDDGECDERGPVPDRSAVRGEEHEQLGPQGALSHGKDSFLSWQGRTFLTNFLGHEREVMLETTTSMRFQMHFKLN